MDGFFTDIEPKKQSKALRAYHPEKDYLAQIKQVLGAVYSDMREKSNQEIYSSWGVPPHLLKQADVKVHGDRIAISLFDEQGGHRVPQADPRDLEVKGKEVLKDLDKLVKAFKAEFKKRTGKALSLSKPEKDVDWNMVALNGLFRFHASYIATIKTNFEPQEHPSDKEDVDAEAMDR